MIEKMAKPKQNPNIQRTNVKNPIHPAYRADRANRIQQGHANVPPPPKVPAQAPKK